VREQKPITRLIEELLARAKIRHLKNLHPQFNQALLNLERIKAFARSFEEQGTGLFDFIAWLDNMDVSGDNGWPEMFALESDDAVNLMTFHKSKGLEFPIAILANLSSSLPQGAERLIKNWKRQELALSIGKFQTANYSSLEQDESRHTDSQNIRTLYVAATRAKQYLVIPDHRSLGYDKGGGLYMDQLIAGLPDPEGGNNPAPKIIAVEKMSRFAAPQQPIEYGLEKFAEAAPADTEIEKSREQFGKILCGKIALAREFQELSAPSREEEFEQVQGKEATAREDALEIGGIVHHVIELAGKQDEKFAMALANRLAKERGAAKLLPQIQALIKEFWKSEIKQKIDAGESWQELPFLAEVQGKLYRGQIDLILREKDGLHILDFKTDNITQDQGDKRAEKYRGQMKIYAEVAARLKKQKVSETSILFLKPHVKKEL
jgi:ATP-dependent helicase/nuclease subunit A